jgi:hypothetical protein
MGYEAFGLLFGLGGGNDTFFFGPGQCLLSLCQLLHSGTGRAFTNSIRSILSMPSSSSHADFEFTVFQFDYMSSSCRTAESTNVK